MEDSNEASGRCPTNHRGQNLNDKDKPGRDQALSARGCPCGHSVLLAHDSSKRASLLGKMDSTEAEVRGEREHAALQQAQGGKPHGRIAYGWRRQYHIDGSGRITGFHDVLNPEQALIVREIVGRLLTGEPLRSVVSDLNVRRVPTPGRRGEWRPNTVTQIARRPSNAGLRVYKGQIMGPGSWPAIIDRDTHNRIASLLENPKRRHSREGGRKYLLSYGIGQCGACGAALVVKTKRTGTPTGEDQPGRLVYRCKGRDKGVSRDLRKVDELVGTHVVERLRRPDTEGIFDGNTFAEKEARKRAEVIRKRLDSAADQFAEGKIDAQQLGRITARLRPELDAAEANSRRSHPIALPVQVDQLHGPDAARVWNEMPVTAKRAVMQMLGLSVVIMPSKKKGRRFDPTEIVFRWQSSEETKPQGCSGG